MKKAFLFLAAAAYRRGARGGRIRHDRRPSAIRRLAPGRARAGPQADAGKAAAAAGLKKKFDALAPKGVYIVVDTGANRFYLKKGAEIVRKGSSRPGAGTSCRTRRESGSGSSTRRAGNSPSNPRSRIRIGSSPTGPSSRKASPSRENAEDRVVGGELGDYALGFGSGYFLHGTLYTRLLGRNVTHGCVRIGDEDLKFLFRSASIGTKIYIY